jgi:hypothetical protein
VYWVYRLFGSPTSDEARLTFQAHQSQLRSSLDLEAHLLSPPIT